MQFPELTIRTYGSVGLDQTLAITAEINAPLNRLGNIPVAAALRNRTIKIPIGGTLSKPKLDERALGRNIQDTVDRGVRDALEGELGRQLDGLQDLLRRRR